MDRAALCAARFDDLVEVVVFIALRHDEARHTSMMKVQQAKVWYAASKVKRACHATQERTLREACEETSRRKSTLASVLQRWTASETFWQDRIRSDAILSWIMRVEILFWLYEGCEKIKS
jgi:hypothetical protein